MSNLPPICIDASLILRLILLPPSIRLKQQWQVWANEQREFVAPTLLYYETTNVIHQYYRLNKISAQKAQESQAFILSIPLQLFGDTNLHQKALRLSRQFALSATYDAHYLAVAEMLEAELWTADKKLFKVVSQQFSFIHLWQE